jgi:bifunctional DNA-binding transcriptional regulator/antitoxin component of YhaV-PrlF toxin-antitoxin module
MPEMRLICKPDRRGRFVLPRKIREALELRGEDDQLYMELNGKVLTILNYDHVRVVLPREVSPGQGPE